MIEEKKINEIDLEHINRKNKDQAVEEKRT